MTRPSVQRFAEQMEQKLFENDHKADWLTETVGDLLVMLRDECRELREAVECGTSMEIVREAADVANIAMMIADHYDLRLGSRRKGNGEAVRP